MVRSWFWWTWVLTRQHGISPVVQAHLALLADDWEHDMAVVRAAWQHGWYSPEAAAARLNYQAQQCLEALAYLAIEAEAA